MTQTTWGLTVADPIAWLADRLWGLARELPPTADPYDDPSNWSRAADPQPAAEES